MTTDTQLLLFVAGFLAGVGATVLAVRVPDFVATTRHIVAEFRSRAERSSRRRRAR